MRRAEERGGEVIPPDSGDKDPITPPEGGNGDPITPPGGGGIIVIPPISDGDVITPIIPPEEEITPPADEVVPSEEEEDVPSKVENTKVEKEDSVDSDNISSLDDMFENTNVVEPEKEKLKIEDKEDTYDLQKELEAKFDELFGPIDDN